MSTTSKPGPRQTLVDHIAEFHPSLRVAANDTAAALGTKHARDHWQHWFPRHEHRAPGEGPNLGPTSRPRGWRTGDDVVVLRERES